jgi:acetyl esterase/lipase
MSNVIRKLVDAVTGDSSAAGRPDADMQEVLNELASLTGCPLETLRVAAARAQPSPADAVSALLREQGKDPSSSALVPGVASVDRQIDGAAGPLNARIYSPDGEGPFPVVVYFHGGGWVIADKDTYDGGARGLSKTAHAIVVSVDYWRSPEAKFPAAWDDAIAAYRWVAQHASSLNGNAIQLPLAGESPGGTPAIATAIAVRDHGGISPLAVLAVCPGARRATCRRTRISTAPTRSL